MAANDKPLVEAPGYQGPERRDRLVIGPCDCHFKHQRILDEHDREIAQIKTSRERRRRELEETTEEQHRDMWTDIKAKVPNKLFYLFISVYSVLFILGIISVYTGMHKNALTFLKGISEVKVMQAELKATLKSTQEKVTDLKNDINGRIGPARRN